MLETIADEAFARARMQIVRRRATLKKLLPSERRMQRVENLLHGG
jgi:hypothetical protein